MPRKKIPNILVIEDPDPGRNIILALEDLDKNNKQLKESICSNTKRLDQIRRLLRGL